MYHKTLAHATHMTQMLTQGSIGCKSDKSDFQGDGPTKGCARLMSVHPRIPKIIGYSIRVK